MRMSIGQRVRVFSAAALVGLLSSVSPSGQTTTPAAVKEVKAEPSAGAAVQATAPVTATAQPSARGQEQARAARSRSDQRIQEWIRQHRAARRDRMTRDRLNELLAAVDQPGSAPPENPGTR